LKGFMAIAEAVFKNYTNTLQVHKVTNKEKNQHREAKSLPCWRLSG